MNSGRLKISPTPSPLDVGTTTVELEKGLDLSCADRIRLTLVVTASVNGGGAGDASDTIDCFLDSRDGSGLWEERARVPQVLASLTPTPTAPEVRVATVSQGPLSGSEEALEPSAPASTSLPTTGGVVNGHFPRNANASGLRAAAWRVRFLVTDADDDAQFEAYAFVEWS